MGFRLRPSFVSFTFLALTLSHCGRPPQKNDSGLSFAHFPATSALGGPLGRVLALQQGFTNDFPKLRICTNQTTETQLTPQELVFETRLAYVAWLQGAELASDRVWQMFEFYSGDCHNENAAAGFVTLGLHGGAETQMFSVPKIDCHSDATARGCRSTPITLGLGGPGSVATWFRQSSPNKWTKLAHGRPSSTWLSPFTNWTSLRSFVKQALDKEPSNAELLALSTGIEATINQDNPALDALLQISQQIADLQLKDGEDQVFNQLSQDFFRSRRTTLQQEYKANYSAFHVLLHEIGHEFGMDHADNPSENSVTGGNIATRQNAAGQFVTNKSSMAYADPYFYLTEDDRQGVLDLRHELEKLLATHKE